MKHPIYYCLTLLSLTFLAGSPVIGQQSGCTDPLATNFDALAIFNDGSCKYLPVIHDPDFAFELPQLINETSGLVFFRDRIWTFNDSQGDAVLYALDTVSGKIQQTVRVANATNVDWEEITMDDNYLYIGDFGNNNGTRKDLCIYRIPLNQIPEQQDGTVDAEIINFNYPDQVSFLWNKQHNFDCEAFVALNNQLYLFSKNRGDQHSKLYRLKNSPGIQEAELISSFDTRGLITGASLNRQDNEIVLTGYVMKVWTPFVWILFDYDGDDFFSGNKRRIDFLNLPTVQTEGVCYTSGKNLMISAEQTSTFSARVFRFNTASWTDHLSQLSKKRNLRKTFITIVDSTDAADQLKIILNRAPAGAARVDITDASGKLLKSAALVVPDENEYSVEIDISALKPGKYLVSLIYGKKIVSQDFVK